MRLIQTKNYKIAANEYGDLSSKKLCILLPGRLDTKDYINFVSHGELLSKKGYYVIAIDPPFTWESPGDINNYCTSEYLRAVNELISELGDRNTLLLGHSRGGATAMLASENPNVEAVVLVNAAYGYPSLPTEDEIVDGYLTEFRDLPPGDKRTEEKIEFKLPVNYFTDGSKYNPADAFKKFRGPKLLFHSTNDEFCSVSSVRKVYEELSKPKMFLEIGKTHDYRLYPEVIKEVNNVIVKFIDETVGNNEKN